MRLNKLKNTNGFTIIETMIFLAVSGVMFLMAASFINGKEGQAEFNQGMNLANSKITSIIDNVSDGNYPFPDNKTITCSILNNRPTISINTEQSYTQSGCDFIGVYLSPETNGNPSVYSLYTVTGCEYYEDNSGLGECSPTVNSSPPSLAAEFPTVVQPLDNSNSWSDGINIYKMELVTGGKVQPIGGVGFFSDLPSNVGGVLSSGSTYVSLVTLNGSSLSDNSQAVTSAINNTNSQLGTHSGASYLDNGYVVMCFMGGNGEKGSITIGSPNGGIQITSSLGIGPKLSTVC